MGHRDDGQREPAMMSARSRRDAGRGWPWARRARGSSGASRGPSRGRRGGVAHAEVVGGTVGEVAEPDGVEGRRTRASTRRAPARGDRP